MRNLRDWARVVKRDVTALSTAVRDRRVPLHGRVLGVLIVGYALSPIDLIPDFIPVVGLLDDIIIVPLGIVVLLRIIPKDVMEEHRMRAESSPGARKSGLGMIIVAAIWLLSVAVGAWLVWRWLSHAPARR